MSKNVIQSKGVQKIIEKQIHLLLHKKNGKMHHTFITITLYRTLVTSPLYVVQESVHFFKCREITSTSLEAVQVANMI